MDSIPGIVADAVRGALELSMAQAALHATPDALSDGESITRMIDQTVSSVTDAVKTALGSPARAESVSCQESGGVHSDVNEDVGEEDEDEEGGEDEGDEESSSSSDSDFEEDEEDHKIASSCEEEESEDDCSEGEDVQDTLEESDVVEEFQNALGDSEADEEDAEMCVQLMKKRRSV